MVVAINQMHSLKLKIEASLSVTSSDEEIGNQAAVTKSGDRIVNPSDPA